MILIVKWDLNSIKCIVYNKNYVFLVLNNIVLRY